METYEAMAGESIKTTCLNMQTMASAAKCSIRCDFNGIEIVATQSTTTEYLVGMWNEKMERRRKEHLESPEHKARMSELAKRDAENKSALKTALASSPEMEIINESAWKKWTEANSDGYGGRVIRYAEEWARLMQSRIANGESLESVADETSHLADDDGITGFMYGAAVSVLSETWKHGESLRRWHNSKTQISTEGDEANESGGVLNPALLNVSK